MDLLETSLLVKKTQYAPPDPMYATVRSKNAAAAVMFKELYKTPSPLIDPETGEPMEATPPNDFETENVVADAAMYDALGLGLSRGEMYGVMLAMKRLGEDPEKKLATVRFFGKMLGTTADYYVFESTLKEPAPAPEGETAEGEVPPEASGQGANTYTYFVCQTLGGPFTKLPDVTPRDDSMRAADQALPHRRSRRRRLRVPRVPRPRGGLPSRDDREDRVRDRGVPRGDVHPGRGDGRGEQG